MKKICVFCGSNTGFEAEYTKMAADFGRFLVENGHELVYGGGKTGIMGAIADGVLAADGRVTGVIPTFLMEKEVGHEGISEMIVVENMHQRKQTMAALADAFVALPGGVGTLEELCEIVTWSQLHLHQKPIGVLNVAGYYDGFLQFFDHMVGKGFLSTANRGILLSANTPEELWEKMKAFRPAQGGKWLDLAKT